MGDTGTLFRLIAASALIGLLAYCTAYVVQIWRRRNARPDNSTTGTSSLRKLGWVCVLMGLVLTPAAGVLRELTRTEGVLTGEDLYVVRSSDDMAVEWVQDRDSVAAGELLARFGSSSRTAKADELKARVARAGAERDVLALSPLPSDPELTRRCQNVSQERSQVEQELGQAITAAEVAHRDLTTQLLAKKEALIRLERTLTERHKELNRANLRLEHSRKLVGAYADLRAKGTISSVEYQEFRKAFEDAQLEVASLSQELKDGQSEKTLLQSHVMKLETRCSDPTSPLQVQVVALETRLSRLKAEEAELRKAIDKDLARCNKLREAETAQAIAKVREQQAGLDGLGKEQEVRAPFAGRIAYRAPSPNAMRQRGAVLVLGPDNGFLLTARLARSEVDALRDGGEVMLEVGEDSPERRVPAQFRKTASLAHEPDHAALQLECQPPPEVVRRLAEGEKLNVVFAWHPPLASMWPFRAGIILLAVGFLALIFSHKDKARTTVQTLKEWRQPWQPQVAASFQAVETSRLETITNDSSNPMVFPALENSEQVLVEDSSLSDTVIESADSEVLLKELKEFYQDTLDRLQREECPDEACQLLNRLHQVRSRLHAADQNSDSSRHGVRQADRDCVAGSGS